MVLVMGWWLFLVIEVVQVWNPLVCICSVCGGECGYRGWEEANGADSVSAAETPLVTNCCGQVVGLN